MGALVTGNTFALLGLQAAHGRLLLPAEEDPGSHPVVVLGHTFWKTHFGSDPAVVGQEISLNGRSYAIVGIAPEGFAGLLRGVSADLFVPLAMQQALSGDSLDERGKRGLMLIGRLREDVSIDAARARFALIAGQHFTDHPGVWSNVRGEGLLLRSLANAGSIDPGFTACGVLAFSVDLGSRGYDEARGRIFFDQLIERLSALPGVNAASLASRVPLAIGGGRRGRGVEGYTAAAGEDMEVHDSVVAPGYFETMRTALAEGRSFDRAAPHRRKRRRYPDGRRWCGPRRQVHLAR